MDYISKLTDEELGIICSLIPIRHFRDYFKSKPQKFQKICPGRRADKVTPELVEKLVIKYRDDLFVSSFLDFNIQQFLNEIQNEISTCTDNGDNIHTALLQTLPKSIFYNHIDIYLKLSQEEYISEYADLMKSALREIETKNASTTDTVNSVDSDSIPAADNLQEELENLKRQMELLHTKETEQQEINASLQTDLLVKDQQLKEQHEKFENLQAEFLAKEEELSELQKRMDYADFPTDTSEVEGYPFISLCRVGGINGNHIELHRIADVIDGVIQTQWREDAPNRRFLYTKDRSKEKDYIGIWAWKATPNQYSDSGYIESELLATQVPVQIVLIQNCDTVKELKNNLIEGIENLSDRERFLFSFFTGERYIGLLCDSKNIYTRNGKVMLKSDVVSLPLYEFSEQEIVKTNQLWFFYRVNLGVPKSLVRIMEPQDAVKNTVLSRISRTRLKQKFAIRDIQNFKEFLRDMPSVEFYREIANTLRCPIETAKEYTDDFIQRAEVYLQSEDIESDILETVLEHSPKLLERCRLLNEEVWRKQHTELLEQAKAELDQANEMVRRQRDQYAQLIEQETSVQKELKALSIEIVQKEKLAEDVEEKIAHRINAARKNAADFICEMAFAQPITSSQTMLSSTAESLVFQKGTTLKTTVSEYHEPWDIICSIQDELEKAGVSEQYALSFAAYLYAAYIAHVPLLLAGPNGREIADAFSAALFNRTASVLLCEGKYVSNIFQELTTGEGEVTVVLNIFHGDWIDHISEFTAIKNKFLIAVHPFAEDLVIEPKGLYNYMLPVLTEIFVDKEATGDYAGGQFSEDYESYTPVKPQKKMPFEDNLSISPLVHNRLCQILADMKNLSNDNSNDAEILFGTFPYAYVTGKIDTLREDLLNYSLSRDAKKLLRSFWGEIE